MAGLKKINTVTGTGNPVMMRDLRYLWEGVISACTQVGSQTSIISGFSVSNGQIGEGIISFNGTPYYLPPMIAAINQYLYAQEVPDDPRVYENGATHDFYTNYVINASNDGAATGIGTLIGHATEANITLWKSAFIAPKSVSGTQIADKTITGSNVADKTIAANNIADGVIPTIPDSLPPNGPAGGTLSGTYPNPTLRSGSVGEAELLPNLKLPNNTTAYTRPSAPTNDYVATTKYVANELSGVPRALGVSTDNQGNIEFTSEDWVDRIEWVSNGAGLTGHIYPKSNYEINTNTAIGSMSARSNTIPPTPLVCYTYTGISNEYVSFICDAPGGSGIKYSVTIVVIGKKIA